MQIIVSYISTNFVNPYLVIIDLLPLLLRTVSNFTKLHTWHAFLQKHKNSKCFSSWRFNAASSKELVSVPLFEFSSGNCEGRDLPQSEATASSVWMYGRLYLVHILIYNLNSSLLHQVPKDRPKYKGLFCLRSLPPTLYAQQYHKALENMGGIAAHLQGPQVRSCS